MLKITTKWYYGILKNKEINNVTNSLLGNLKSLCTGGYIFSNKDHVMPKKVPFITIID